MALSFFLKANLVLLYRVYFWSAMFRGDFNILQEPPQLYSNV